MFIVCIKRPFKILMSDPVELQVNGESVIGMAHNKAVALIKNASNLVSLVISR